MPYHHDLPNYYIYVLNPSGEMVAYNDFEMGTVNIFSESALNSLTFSCLDNYVGVKNTVCTVLFGTQHPLKADANIMMTFVGMQIATDSCDVFLSNGT